MKKEDPPVCTSCGTPLTVNHILTECLSYADERRDADLSNQLYEILSPVQCNVQSILRFLQSTKLMNKI